jgi:chromosomal replication initiator protein
MTPQLACLVPAWYRPPYHLPQTLRTAADVFGISLSELTGDSRFTDLVRARWAVMLAMRARGVSMPRIGAALGGRDHTTILHGLKKATALRATDPAFASKCAAVAAG